MMHTPAPWNFPLSWFDPKINVNAEADKALADAAPELLAALIAASKAIHPADRAWRIARAAIAKATKGE